ncbi:MAG TPA: DsbC family protein [Woeseiaceae bacterium]|nr:DsbC family protein [Woeseiaceae bacterium]
MKSIPFVLMLMLTVAVATSHAADAGLTTVLERLGIDRDAELLRPAPLPGFLEVTRGMQVLYVSSDGAFVINGDILAVGTETNLTEKRRADIRRERLRSVPESETLLVPARAPAVTRVIVFTDVDCPYCLALHRRHDELLQRGVEIQYLFYPRSGPASASFDQAVAVWCSEDRLEALDRALRGENVPEADCAHPVRRHYELARALELKGTPAVITVDGTVKYGMHSAEDILELLGGPGGQ